MFHYRQYDDKSPGTVQDLLPAADHRIRNASDLVARDPTCSVYLAGYVVECVLKHAALRITGAAVYDPVSSALQPMRARIRLWLGPVAHESFHSLEFWALGLREGWRHERGSVPTIVNQAVQRAGVLHQGWKVNMRYRSQLVLEADAREVLARASWFVASSNSLWRQ